MTSSFTARCRSCNTICHLPSLKARAVACDACTRKRGAALNEARPVAARGFSPGFLESTKKCMEALRRSGTYDALIKAAYRHALAEKPAKRPFAVGDRVVVNSISGVPVTGCKTAVVTEALPSKLEVRMDGLHYCDGAWDGDFWLVYPSDLEHA